MCSVFVFPIFVFLSYIRENFTFVCGHKKRQFPCFSVEVPLLPLTPKHGFPSLFSACRISGRSPSDSPALLIKFYLTDSFFAKFVKSYVHKLPASQISSFKEQKSCYHSSRQDLVQAQTLARCSRNQNWSTGPIIDMPCKKICPHTCGQILTFSFSSLRWHYPNQVRSKIYLPLSLSHKLPFLYSCT